MIVVTKPTFKHKAFAILVFVILRFWYATLRIKVDRENFDLASNSRKILGLAWHNRIFFLPFCKVFFRKKIPMCALISPSRDGAYLDALLALFGVVAVRGSSKKRGGSAVMGLVRKMEEGFDAFITPDGPRGPKYKAKEGAVKVAELANANILVVRINPRRFFQFNSWDNCMLPMPFTSVDFKFELVTYERLCERAEKEGVSPSEVLTELLRSGQK